MREKFHLGFEIVTRGMIDASYAGNPFLEKDLLIARLDHLSRTTRSWWPSWRKASGTS